MMGQNLKNGSHALTKPLCGVIYHNRLGFDIVYLHAKFDDSSFSRSKKIGGDKI